MTISGTTIHDNHALDGNSGGIRSNSRLIMIDSTISDNTSTDLGAGLYVASNTATITGTTISGNYSTDGAGGLFNSGTTTFTNGTISGNQADKDGGGVFNFGTLTFINSTISDNSAALQGDGFRLASGTITLQNTIIANSPDDNCYDSSGLPYNYYSLGGNLSDDDTCNFTESSDLNDTEADLGPLADNGGPTRTHLPQSGSPAIDHTACAVATDQRGIDRPQGADCDIGAVEVLAAEQLPLCVNGYTGAVSTPWSGKCPPGQQHSTLPPALSASTPTPVGFTTLVLDSARRCSNAPDAGRWCAPDLCQPLHRQQPGGDRPHSVSRLRAAEHHPGDALSTESSQAIPAGIA